LDHETYDKAGEEFGVSRETLRRIVKSRQEDSILFSSPKGGLGFGKLNDILKKRK
jgi:DNA-binding FadR family transcriptional regulator